MHTGVITNANPTPVCTVPEVQPTMPGCRCSYLWTKWLVSGIFHQAKSSCGVHLGRRAEVWNLSLLPFSSSFFLTVVSSENNLLHSFLIFFEISLWGSVLHLCTGNWASHLKSLRGQNQILARNCCLYKLLCFSSWSVDYPDECIGRLFPAMNGKKDRQVDMDTPFFLWPVKE